MDSSSPEIRFGSYFAGPYVDRGQRGFSDVKSYFIESWLKNILEVEIESEKEQEIMHLNKRIFLLDDVFVLVQL